MWTFIDCKQGPKPSWRVLFRDFTSPCFWLVLMFCLSGAWGEEECLNSRIWCYDCESWNDIRCKDPFNHTGNPDTEPAQKICEGCCVKIVSHYNTRNETVRRTCTQNLQINLFLVDHVCMYESRNTGHMCFCESERCNSAPEHQGSLLLWLTATVLSLLVNRSFMGV